MHVIICDKESAIKASVEQKLRERLGGADIQSPTETFDWSEEEIAERAVNAHVIVTAATPITDEILGSGDKLAYVVKTGVGVDNIQVQAATDRGVLVSRTPGVNDEGVAEHVIGMIISLNKNMLIADRRLRRGDWDYRKEITGTTRELRKKTLGIVGFGTIGRRLAEMAIALDMEVLAFDPYVDGEIVESIGGALVGLDELLERSRYVSLNCVLTDETHHLIGAREFRLMADNAYLINTSRGPVVDEQSLVDTLENKEIAGAGIDVFENEPPDQQNRLFEYENVIVTPHISGTTYEGYRKIGDMIAEDIAIFSKGSIPDEDHIVNPMVLEDFDHPFS